MKSTLVGVFSLIIGYYVLGAIQFSLNSTILDFTDLFLLDFIGKLCDFSDCMILIYIVPTSRLERVFTRILYIFLLLFHLKVNQVGFLIDIFYRVLASGFLQSLSLCFLCVQLAIHAWHVGLTVFGSLLNLRSFRVVFLRVLFFKCNLCLEIFVCDS